MSNITNATFDGSRRKAITCPLFQYDYGQILKISGVELPVSYQVQFSNSEDGGISKTMLGDADGVQIPDEYLLTGDYIYAFIFLHEGEDDGETEYVIEIPVIRRPVPSEETPTPAEQSLINQLLAQLNEGVEAAEESEAAAAASESSAAASAAAATAAAATATQKANLAENSATAAVASESSATASAATATAAAATATTKANLAADSATTAAQAADEITEAAEQIATNTADISHLKSDLSDLTTRVDNIEEAEGLHRYGVSGIGQAASALTRIWDSVGMTAQVGTDGDNSNIVNNFDDVTPFNRRKCVGKWHLEDGRAVFRVHAYYGDDDYAEDGSMGDFVAVECPRAYYYMDGGILGVSAHQYPGWRPFDIFCRNHNPEDTIPFYYLPAYALALDENGHAVSLPGYDNFQGDYKRVLDAARTYDGGTLGNLAIIQPMAVNFYEWALYTVEFAQQNSQNIMYGCGSLRHNNDDRATLRSDGKWLLSNYYAARVVGEYISIQPTNVDINNVNYYASHKITSITRCDSEGNAASNGTYQLVETEDLGSGRTYEVGQEYRFAARPYRTGACNSVSAPSGSPVSNTSGCYPMKYRWRENVFGNQYKTICDLFNKRVGTGDDDWMLEWYLLHDPSEYEPSADSKPDAADLETDAFVKLDVETEHANYVNGYVKSKKYASDYPDVWIPHETVGASASTYFADYASLVSSYVVRACRVGGYWYSGAYVGFSYLIGHSAPSNASAYYGGDLCMLQ